MEIKEHSRYRIPGISDRYFPPKRLKQVLDGLKGHVPYSTVGKSVQEQPIYSLQLGDGPIRVLIWSQMHGNESTTTRAVLDFVMAYAHDADLRKRLSPLSIYLIPMLNPDGALAYTRNNANNMDLNRDAEIQSQPETRVLFKVFESFKPDFCFNLHDQRTRYGVGDPPVAANMSFLAPSADKVKSVTKARKSAMKLIVHMTRMLQRDYQVNVGRYDDAFNANCVGDTFTKWGIPCMLFESGFFPGDYNREKTRTYIYYALLWALDGVTQIERLPEATEIYFKIQENKSCFADIILRNTSSSDTESPEDVVLNYEEQLVNRSIQFVPARLSEEYADTYIGHTVYDLMKKADKEQVMSDPQLKDFIE